MDAAFWHSRWEQNEIGFHQQEINSHLQAFWDEISPSPAASVFVPLCGKSRDMLWLLSQGFQVVGVELSPLAVEAFFEENRLDPEITTKGDFQHWRTGDLDIWLGDFFRLAPEDLKAVGSVYDRASLVALPPEMRARYADHLQKILPREINRLLITMDYPQEEMKGPPFAVSHDEVLRLFAATHELTRLGHLDVLEENPRFREKGLSRLHEHVYRLIPLKDP